MSATMHLVLENFIWRITTISPTETNLTKERFVYYDPEKKEPQQSTGWVRKFYVEWLDSDADSAATDSNRREAWHVFRVHIEYPVMMSSRRMHKLVSQDRHDLTKQLRSGSGTGSTNRLGYDADNTSTDIGLYHRWRSGDELNRENPKIWRYSAQWRCKIRESEL